ncbi:TadE family protein [Microbacterium amylolyticum]|uniref:Flp pilus assembly protein TadG n=1 Tax=Microbacterium amylolyticum TaxID=936337 RepID=A0ABS4ZLD6_9MICO|nr:TadE family protein [Microbacterium amylolyticum]MBP2437813.1 Flp pilus assembly protein TadG [Microbacterium amylolyticum]
MHQRRSPDDDRGSAPLEFLLAGLLLLVPLAYLVVAVTTVQNAALAADATARFVARSLTTGIDPDTTLRVVADSYGIDLAALDMTMACAPVSAPCPQAGSTVVVHVTVVVALPLVPDFLAGATSIPVEAHATQKISRYWEAP